MSATEPVAEPDKDLASKRITIAAVGDMMLGTDYPENHLPDDDGSSFLAHVTPILAGADVTFGNLGAGSTSAGNDVGNGARC